MGGRGEMIFFDLQRGLFFKFFISFPLERV